jgi:hypothetical protein
LSLEFLGVHGVWAYGDGIYFINFLLNESTIFISRASTSSRSVRPNSD